LEGREREGTRVEFEETQAQTTKQVEGYQRSARAFESAEVLEAVEVRHWFGNCLDVNQRWVGGNIPDWMERVDFLASFNAFFKLLWSIRKNAVSSATTPKKGIYCCPWPSGEKDGR